MTETQQAIVLNEESLLQAAKPPLPENLQRFLENALRMARDLEINSREDYEASFQMRRSLTNNKKLIEGILSSNPVNKNMLSKLHKAAVAHWNSLINPLEEADDIVEKKRIAYDVKQRQIAAEQETREREVAVQTREEQVLSQAQELTEAGEVEAADAVLEAAAAAPAPVVVVQPDIPKQKGVSKRETWKFRIVNEAAIPRQYLSVDESKIGAVVRALKDKHGIPGVEAYSEDKESIRST